MGPYLQHKIACCDSKVQDQGPLTAQTEWSVHKGAHMLVEFQTMESLGRKKDQHNDHNKIKMLTA